MLFIASYEVKCKLSGLKEFPVIETSIDQMKVLYIFSTCTLKVSAGSLQLCHLI